MSRFDEMMKTAKQRGPTPPTADPDPAPAPKSRQAETTGRHSPAPPEPPAARRPGRPTGKKSDPTFEQVTAYVPRELYGEVRGALWKDHDRREFSSLVEELLREWLESQNSR